MMLVITGCAIKVGDDYKKENVSVSPEVMYSPTPEPIASLPELSEKEKFLFWANDSGFTTIWEEYSKAVSVVTKAVELDAQGKESFATMSQAVSQLQILKYRFDSIAKTPNPELLEQIKILSAQITLLSDFKNEISKGDLSRRDQIVSTLQNMTNITNNINAIISKEQNS